MDIAEISFLNTGVNTQGIDCIQIFSLRLVLCQSRKKCRLGQSSVRVSQLSMHRREFMKVARLVLVFMLLSYGYTTNCRSEDWPQWNGPRRDGSVRENNLIETIPIEGLKPVWRRPVSYGYSGPIVADNKAFVFDYVKTRGEITNNAGKRDELTGKERLNCFNAATGEPLWTYDYDRTYSVSYGSGPRATPSFHQGLVYLLGAEGDLTCVDANSGKKVWHVSFSEVFGAKTPLWGHAASPLVHGPSLICMVGGQGSLVVAFDLKSGKEQWRALSNIETGYCPATIVKRNGSEQLIIWDPERISSLNPENGSVFWQHPLKPDYGMSILPPMNDGDMLFTGGEGSKGVMLKLKPNAAGVEPIWSGRPKLGVYLATSNGIFHDGHLYGADIRSGALVCANGSTGKRLWQTALPTTGSTRGRGGAHGTVYLLKRSGKRYILFSETGDVISAELSPEGYRETGRFHAIEPTSETLGRKVVWTFPAIANGKLYLRNDREIVCYSLTNHDK